MERDFAEQPVRLPGLGTLVVRPSFSPPPPDAALLGHTEAFGTRLRRAASERGWRICLAEDSCDRNAKVIRRLYVCPAALVKVSPQMDETIAEILRRDKEGAVLLLEGRVSEDHILRSPCFHSPTFAMASLIDFMFAFVPCSLVPIL